MERERYSDSSLLSGSLFPLLGHGYFGDSSESDFSHDSSVDGWSLDGDSLGSDGGDDEDDGQEDYDHNDPDAIFEFWNAYGDSDDWDMYSSSGDGEGEGRAEGTGSDEEDHDEAVRRVMQALEEVEAGSEEAWRELERAALRADKEDEERRREIRGAEGGGGGGGGERGDGEQERSSDGTEQNGNSRKRVRGEREGAGVEGEEGRLSGDNELQDEQKTVTTQDDGGIATAGDLQNSATDARQRKGVAPRASGSCGRASKRRAESSGSPLGSAEPIAGTSGHSEAKDVGGAYPGTSSKLGACSVSGSGELGGASSVNGSSDFGGTCSVNGSQLGGACSVNGSEPGGTCSMNGEACSTNSSDPSGQDCGDDDTGYPKAKSKRQRLVELNSGNADFSHYSLEDFLKPKTASFYSHSDIGKEQ